GQRQECAGCFQGRECRQALPWHDTYYLKRSPAMFALFSRPLRAGNHRPLRRRQLRCEALEDRTVTSTVFVDDSLLAGASLASLGGRVTLDRDGSGTLTDGDQVIFALGEANQTTALTFRAGPTSAAPV